VHCTSSTAGPASLPQCAHRRGGGAVHFFMLSLPAAGERRRPQITHHTTAPAPEVRAGPDCVFGPVLLTGYCVVAHVVSPRYTVTSEPTTQSTIRQRKGGFFSAGIFVRGSFGGRGPDSSHSPSSFCWLQVVLFARSRCNAEEPLAPLSDGSQTATGPAMPTKLEVGAIRGS
jgi:hypothetical protein